MSSTVNEENSLAQSGNSERQIINLRISVPMCMAQRYRERIKTILKSHFTDIEIMTVVGSQKDIDIEILERVETIYKKYPRQMGKARGIATITAQLRKSKDASYFLKCLDEAVYNYSHYIKDSKTDKQYVKMFSTFSNEWQDWTNYKPQKEVKCLNETLNSDSEINQLLLAV